MVNNIQAIQFQANWNQENKHLERNVFEKISQFVFYYLNRFARQLILPSSTKSPEQIKQADHDFNLDFPGPIPSNLPSNPQLFLNRNFTTTPIEVKAPDGTLVKGTHFKYRSAANHAPTVIFFQPNATYSKNGVFNWVLKQAAIQDFSYNFVYFDYPGSDGRNNKPLSKNDPCLAGDAIYQCVRDQFKVPEKDIHLYGYSFGGAVAAYIKAMHPKCTGNYVNDRSFTSINDLLPNLMHPVISKVAAFFISLVNWNLNPAKVFPDLKGRTLVVHHPKDELMKGNASLAPHFSSHAGISRLDLGRSGLNSTSYHSTPLEAFATKDFNPTEEVTKFLFSSSVSRNQRMIQLFRNASQNFQNLVHHIVAKKYQNGGYYLGSGADACHNRNGQRVSEQQLADAIITAKMHT